jgi:SAM-dependent methyltransferase
MRTKDILNRVSRYYTNTLARHGLTARGVDWNTTDSQELRFAQFLPLLPSGESFSILDFGCGFGSIVDYLSARFGEFEYFGYDCAPAMVQAGRHRYRDRPRTTFSDCLDQLPATDYCLACGIFNVKGVDVDDRDWKSYMTETIDLMASKSRRGFGFNVLSIYSDPEKRRPDLHYADPLAWFDHCKRTFSRFVSLLHDYPLYEFTVLVRLEDTDSHLPAPPRA